MHTLTCTHPHSHPNTHTKRHTHTHTHTHAQTSRSDCRPGNPAWIHCFRPHWIANNVSKRDHHFPSSTLRKRFVAPTNLCAGGCGHRLLTRCISSVKTKHSCEYRGKSHGNMVLVRVLTREFSSSRVNTRIHSTSTKWPKLNIRLFKTRYEK